MREETLDHSMVPVHTSTPILDELTHTLDTVNIDDTQTSDQVTKNSSVSKEQWHTPKPHATNITRLHEEQSSSGCDKNTKQVRGILGFPAFQRGANMTRFFEEQSSKDLSLNHATETRHIVDERKKPRQNHRSLSATARNSAKACKENLEPNMNQMSEPLTQTSSSNRLSSLERNLDKQFMDLVNDEFHNMDNEKKRAFKKHISDFLWN
ncbi:hypothetical protein DdX_02681 [Ditylenchus destructor]|uniref:Uncharacterized protein n=1 Tax=Ditylenchus destructor TaxID=166010 RepID=A0AAD4RC65_9BILA|nr:hypothetical protein DdX_02681 [Ditylenchus destructor]